MSTTPTAEQVGAAVTKLIADAAQDIQTADLLLQATMRGSLKEGISEDGALLRSVVLYSRANSGLLSALVAAIGSGRGAAGPVASTVKAPVAPDGQYL